MTDENTIAAVTAKLTGEFYQDQRVRTKRGSIGFVRFAVYLDGRKWWVVDLPDGTAPPYLPEELTPL